MVAPVKSSLRRCLWPRAIGHFCREETAATTVEYAVMLALILGVIMGSIGAVGAQAGGWWGNIEAELISIGFGS